MVVNSFVGIGLRSPCDRAVRWEIHTVPIVKLSSLQENVNGDVLGHFECQC
jgi:hypothetical protein